MKYVIVDPSGWVLMKYPDEEAYCFSQNIDMAHLFRLKDVKKMYTILNRKDYLILSEDNFLISTIMSL